MATLNQSKSKTNPVGKKSPSRGNTPADREGNHHVSASRSRSRQKDGKPPISSITKSLSPINLMYLDKEVLTENLKQSNQLMQQHREEGNIRQIRHEQRRRKFMRQLDTSLISQTNKFFEQEVIGQLLNVSQTEQQELDFRSDVYHYKEIIVQNRQNRDKLIEEINVNYQQRQIAWETVEAKREVGWVVKLDTKSQLKRRDALQIASKSANRYEATVIVTEFMNKLLDVVDWTINCREIAGFSYRFTNPAKAKATFPNLELTNSFLPELIWNDIRRLASSKHPFASPLPYLVQILPSTLMMPFNISQRPRLAEADWILTNQFNGAYIYDKPKVTYLEDGTAIEENPQLSIYLAKQDWIDFTSQLQQFNESKPKTEVFETIQYPDFFRDALLTPAWLYQTDPQYVSGETIVQIRTVENPIPEPPSPVVDFSSMPVKIALFGASENSRKLVAKKLASFLPRFTIISVDALVLKAFNTIIPPEKSLEEYTPFEQIVQQIQSSLKNGESIQNHQYAQLLIQEIQSLPTPNNGFVIEDYPNTKEQLLSLLEATSNIRYDQHRPQPKDYQSSYAPLQPSEDWVYDIKNCGIDALLCTDSFLEAKGIEGPLREKVRARLNLFTQEVVYVNEETQSVKGLQYLYDPANPYSTTGLSLTMLEREVKELLELCQKMKLLQMIPYESFPTADEAIDVGVQSLTDLFITNSDLLSEEYWSNLDEQKRLAAEAEAEAAAAATFTAAEVELLEEVAELLTELEGTVEQSKPMTPAATDMNNTATTDPTTTVTEAETTTPAPTTTVETVIEKRIPIIEQTNIPKALATVLSTFWNQAEEHAFVNGQQFYSTIRDLRSETLQRRRIAIDAIYISMLRQDSRQELFNSFRNDFNSITNDLRYDPDCIADLYLRTVQLRNEISKLCEGRYQEVLQLITNYEKDNQINIFLYHLRCEGMFLLQNEMNRFYQLIDLLMDYTKSVQTYQIHEKIANELEILLPNTIYEITKSDGTAGGKGGKGDGKGGEKKADKGKGAAVSTFTPYRELLSPYFINTNIQQLTENIPNRKDAEEVVDPKAKGGKGKDKKDDGATTDPFIDVMKNVLEEIAKWKEGTFTLSRDLYGGNNKDEKICCVIEQSVWFEASKTEVACQFIQNTLENHVQWMEEMEKQTSIILREIAYDRFLLELASGEEVIHIIEQCIQQARPLNSLWLVTPDALPVIDPESAWYRLQTFLPEEDRQRYDTFGGIAKPDPLTIHRASDSLDDIAVTFHADEVTHTGGGGRGGRGGRPVTAPVDEERYRLQSQNRGTSISQAYSSDSFDQNNIEDSNNDNSMNNKSFRVEKTNSQRSPQIRKQHDEISNYSYLKKIMPPMNYHQVQKENYLANQKAAANQRAGGSAGGGSGGGGGGGITSGGGGFGSSGTGTAGRATTGSSTGGFADNIHDDDSNFGSDIGVTGSGGGGKGGRRATATSVSTSRAQSAHHHGHGSGGSSSAGGTRTHSANNHNHHTNTNAHSNQHTHGGGGSRSAHRSHPHSTERPGSGGITDPKEIERYQHERQVLEEKLLLRRELRQKEFIAMGMSVPNAMRAAYNDLLLEEQHAWEDFDIHFRRFLHHSAPEAHHHPGTPPAAH